ncbi:MAG: hypothetical protein EP329_04620 [Deltaproteobacteria bacterium]|nr:MAG: hypothetical protein EP329_04620 [Deltaproteobacteria bacterium]
MQRHIIQTARWAARTVVLSSLVVAGCSKDVASTVEEGGRVSVAVAPLEYPGITDAVYRLTVKNNAGETVWQKTISSAQYGSGDGATSYVGPCDAQSNPNTIELELESLSAGGNVLSTTTDYANPAPLGTPIVLEATCAADKDVPVEFNLNVARAGEQGFFDISVNFQDLFCSAKLDCERGAGQPLELLYQPHTGKRDLTAVLGFACTAGPDQDTYLHMNQVQIECTGAITQTFVVDSQSGPGNLNPPFAGPPNDTDLIFQAATYRGEELIGNSNKFYWNVAIGLNEDAFTNVQPCTLHATATASDGPLVNGTTPDGMRWPYIQWDVPILLGDGTFACTSHELGGGKGVSVEYTTNPISFTASIQRSNSTQTLLNGCDPNEACGDCTSSCLLGSGTGIDNVTDGGGDTAPTLATELETKVNPDDITGLVASPTGGLTLADQNYDLPFLWAANHDDGTVSKIDTRTMKEVGRYYVCGAQGGTGPSRTAVDLQGNAFVTCRFNGHVTKIGVIPPECNDTNGTPGIQTSEDTNGDGTISGAELLPWGQDECILWDKAPAAGVATCNTSSICGRAAGVDVNNDVWVGIWANSTLYRLDGETGTTKSSIAIPERPYGLVIGPNGMIWVASRETNGALVKVNPQTGTSVVWKTGSGNYTGTASTDNYGINIDPWGGIWLGQYAATGLKRFMPNPDGLTGTFSGPYGASATATTRGVGVKVNYDTSGNVTSSEVYGGHHYSTCYNTVSYVKMDAAGAVVKHGIIGVTGASGPIGNAIDVDGNEWAVNYCTGTATRYLVTWDASNNPTVNVHGNVTIGNHPYSYSDMTGQALRNLAGVTGHYQHRWTGWSTGSTWWKSATLDATLPGGDGVTWLQVQWRSADTEAELDNDVVPWTPVFIVTSETAMPINLSPAPDGTTPRINKYFELSIDFYTNDPGGQVPELNGIGLAVYHL